MGCLPGLVASCLYLLISPESSPSLPYRSAEKHWHPGTQVPDCWGFPHGGCPPKVLACASIMHSWMKTPSQSKRSLNLEPNIASDRAKHCPSLCGKSSNPHLWLNSVSRDCTMLMQGPWDLPGPWLTPQLERCPWEASAGLVRHLRFNKRSILLPWISA